MYGASNSTTSTTAREEGGGDTQAGTGKREREYLYQFIQWKKSKVRKTGNNYKHYKRTLFIMKYNSVIY